MELTDETEQVYVETAKALKGSERRLVMARVVKSLGTGGQPALPACRMRLPSRLPETAPHFHSRKWKKSCTRRRSQWRRVIARADQVTGLNNDS